MKRMIVKMSQEKLSSFMDGELDPKELDALLAAVQSDEALLSDWHSWRLASDVLNGCPSCSPTFMKRFSERLTAEPIVLVPRRSRRKAQPVRRLLVPLTMAASVAFVGVAVWRVNEPQQVNAVQIAQGTESTLRDYLVAHRESDGNLFAEGEVIHANFQSVDTH